MTTNEEVVAPFFTLAVVCGVAFCFYQVLFTSAAEKRQSEDWYTVFVYSMLLIQTSIACLLLTGNFFMLLRVKSFLWFFFQALYVPSVAMIFYGFPFLTVAATVWCGIGWKWLGYSTHSIIYAALLSPLLGINIGLYYGFIAVCILSRPNATAEVSVSLFL